jgi:hypothetical protein
MNKLVTDYAVDTQYPDVSGIEHLQMLDTRSRLAEIEDTLTAEERHVLEIADRRLLAHAAEFLAEISRFADLAKERQRLQPPPEYWWWYLDVLARAPVFVPAHEYEPELAPA